MYNKKNEREVFVLNFNVGFIFKDVVVNLVVVQSSIEKYNFMYFFFCFVCEKSGSAMPYRCTPVHFIHFFLKKRFDKVHCAGLHVGVTLHQHPEFKCSPSANEYDTNCPGGCWLDTVIQFPVLFLFALTKVVLILHTHSLPSIHTHIHIYLHPYILTSIYTCIHIYLHPSIPTSIHTYIYTTLASIHPKNTMDAAAFNNSSSCCCTLMSYFCGAQTLGRRRKRNRTSS